MLIRSACSQWSFAVVIFVALVVFLAVMVAQADVVSSDGLSSGRMCTVVLGVRVVVLRSWF